MAEPDDRLERLLEDRGAHLPRTAEADDGEEIARLATLANAVRDMDHPRLPQAAARAQRARFVAAGAGLARPAAARAGFWEKFRSVPVLTGGLAFAVVILACLAALFAGSVWFGLSRQTGMVALSEVNGLVEVSAGRENWQAVDSDQRLKAGQTIRTGPASSVRLSFYEGSSTRLDSNTVVELVEISGGFGRLRVTLNQLSGDTAHRIVPLRGPGSSFIVASPGGEAQVKGTTFQIAVDPQGNTRYAVVSGQVAVRAAGQEVRLLSGQATTVRPGHSPEPPAYQFHGGGMISEISGTTWVIGGVAVTVIDQTEILGDPQVEDFVRVVGRVLDGGLWLADRIEETEPADSAFQFAGLLEAMEGTIWTIGGREILLDQHTDLPPDLEPGDLVAVTIMVLEDGDWLALEIESLEETPEEPTLTPTATPDPEAQPSLSFEPDELVAEGCGQNFIFTGTLVNTGTPPDDYAANVVLGFTILRGAEYVDAVEINPLAWDRIPAGEMVNFTVGGTLDLNWLETSDGSEVKLRLFIANETNRPGHHRTHLALTIISRCEGSPTPTFTPTMTITPTVTATPTVTMTPTLTVTPPDTPPGDGAKVTICHRPPGNPDNAHTITIGRDAVPAHLAHGDTLGPCPGRR